MNQKIFSLLHMLWDACDIGKESEPEEYRGKPLRAYYDEEHTLEASVANGWNYIVTSPDRSEKLSQVIRATEEKKTWLLDLSRPVVPEEMLVEVKVG